MLHTAITTKHSEAVTRRIALFILFYFIQECRHKDYSTTPSTMPKTIEEQREYEREKKRKQREKKKEEEARKIKNAKQREYNRTYREKQARKREAEAKLAYGTVSAASAVVPGAAVVAGAAAAPWPAAVLATGVSGVAAAPRTKAPASLDIVNLVFQSDQFTTEQKLAFASQDAAKAPASLDVVNLVFQSDQFTTGQKLAFASQEAARTAAAETAAIWNNIPSGFSESGPTAGAAFGTLATNLLKNPPSTTAAFGASRIPPVSETTTVVPRQIHSGLLLLLLLRVRVLRSLLVLWARLSEAMVQCRWRRTPMPQIFRSEIFLQLWLRVI